MIRWLASASASVTATCSALTVTLVARSTPRISSTLLRMIEVDRHDALLVHDQLLLQVLDALAQREQPLALDDRAARVAGRELALELAT